MILGAQQSQGPMQWASQAGVHEACPAKFVLTGAELELESKALGKAEVPVGSPGRCRDHIPTKAGICPANPGLELGMLTSSGL